MMSLLGQLVMYAAAATAEPATPIRYAVSGTELTVPVAAKSGDEVLLFAFGQELEKRWRVEDGRVTLRLPEVRVLVAVELRRAEPPSSTLARIAVYPTGMRVFGDVDVDVAALAAPPWFLEWAAAVGIPVRALPTELAVRQNVRPTAEHRLLIVGRESGLADPRSVLELARACNADVVVLDADWYGERIAEPVALHLKEEDNPIRRLNGPQRPGPPSFTWFRGTAPTCINREAAAFDDAHTLIEVMRSLEGPELLVASYVPWQEQLGVNDAADGIFFRLLAATAITGPPEPLDRAVIVYGGPQTWPDDVRPVLSRAARATETQKETAALRVIDLRGDAASGLTVRSIQPLIDAADSRPVLILGDDPVLGSVRGLPPRDVDKLKTDGILWRSADDLPSSNEGQEELMRLLTRFRVPLIPLAEDDR